MSKGSVSEARGDPALGEPGAVDLKFYLLKRLRQEVKSLRSEAKETSWLVDSLPFETEDLSSDSQHAHRSRV